MSAIKLEPASESDEIAQQFKAGLGDRIDKRFVIFLCSHSGAQAVDYIADQIDGSALLVKVPCAGTVDTAHILAAFQEGVKGVIVTGCFKGNCASVYGSSLAEEKSLQTAELLAEIGINSDLVRFVPMAANTPGALLTALKEMDGKTAQ
jgi:coenzyme F420-reducing hydrogenase delta subunit